MCIRKHAWCPAEDHSSFDCHLTKATCSFEAACKLEYDLAPVLAIKIAWSQQRFWRRD